MQHGHQRQHEQRAGTGTGQVEAVGACHVVGRGDEAQADEQAGQEEERQQRRVIQRDVAELRREGRRVLKLQRVERVLRREPVADRGGDDQRGRQRGHQPARGGNQPIPRERERNAAERKADHDDGDDPVAVFAPRGGREIAGERNLDPDAHQRHQEQRGQRAAPRADGQFGHTRRARKSAIALSNRCASSTNSACPAVVNSMVSVFGRSAARLLACSEKAGRTT